MKKANNFLRKFKWYRDWDDHRHSYHWHWVFLAIFVSGIAFGLIIQLWIFPPGYSQAGTTANGSGCNNDSTECASGHCVGVCLPSYPISSDVDIVFDCSDGTCEGETTMCDGEISVSVYGSAASAQSAFDNYGAGTTWGYWPSPYETICGAQVESTWASPNMLYKAVKGSSYFRIFEDEYGAWGCSDDFIEGLFKYVMCGQGEAPSGPVCGNGTCESGETCSSCASDCLSSGQICCSGNAYTGDCCSGNDCDTGETCTSHQCVGSDPCGDGNCDTSGGEDCSTCLTDCACAGGACCDPDALSYTTSYGCALDGGETSSGHICCSGTDYTGDCCDSSDCGTGYECTSHVCTSVGSVCGDGTCSTIDEDCLSCAADCGCFSTECCSPLSWNADSLGCVDTEVITTVNKICCSGTDYSGTCCNYFQCATGETCTDHVCVASGPVCGDGTCDSSESCSSCSSDCGSCDTTTSSMSFGTSGGTQDGGSITSGSHSWTVTIPSNFTKVEITHYAYGSASTIRKYMGWNGYLKVNGEYIWKFNSYSSSTGGLIQDYTLGQEVNETSGHGFWIDATEFFDAGSNALAFYHFNEGDGIGTKVRVTTGTAPYCGDLTCDTGSESCSSCLGDCPCSSSECCVPSSSIADYYGCVDSERITTTGKICCSGTDYSGDCCSDSDCSGDQVCTSHSCVSTGPTCGDGTCESGETCSSCASDCLSSSETCCSGTAYTGDCCSDNDCSGSKECTGHVCVSPGPTCGDGTCNTSESCESCSQDCGACPVEEVPEPEPEPEPETTPTLISNGQNCNQPAECASGNCLQGVCCEAGYDCCEFSGQCASGNCVDSKCVETVSAQLSTETEKLIKEYRDSGLPGRLIQLNDKIVVKEVSNLTVSPFDMHTSIQAEVDILIAAGDDEKLQSLLKHVIAAENLALATYEGEAEMATMLAESSWNSLKAYLIYKVKAMVASRLEKLDLDQAKELADEMQESFTAAEDPEEILKEMGFEDVSAINQAIHQAVNESGGKVQTYLESIENRVKGVYLDAYIDMFNKNFKYAISKQLVYYQVAANHWITEKGVIANANGPYNEYEAKIAAIKKEIEEEKQFIGGDNVFARLISINNDFKDGAEALDVILEEMAAAAWVTDKGASLAGQETKFGDVVGKLQGYNDDLKAAIDVAAESLEFIGIFAESAYGTYKEAKLYSVFFNTYDKWYDASFAGAVTVLEVPLTDKKIDITAVYKRMAPLVGAADKALTKTGQAANYLADGAKSISGAGVQMLKDVGGGAKTTIKTTLRAGKKMTQKLYVGASETASAAGELASGAAKKAGEWYDYGESLIYSVDFSSVFGYNPSEALGGRLYAFAGDKPVVEVALISPSEIRFLGRERTDGSGVDVVVNNPEPGEWTAEIIAKEVEGELPLEITTTMTEENVKELKEEKIAPTEKIEKTTWYVKYLWWIIIAVVIIIAAVIVAMRLRSRKK